MNKCGAFLDIIGYHSNSITFKWSSLISGISMFRYNVSEKFKSICKEELRAALNFKNINVKLVSDAFD